MTTYTFENLLDQIVTFTASADVLEITAFAAAEMSFAQSGANVIVSNGTSRMTLANITLSALTPSNVTFADGSAFAYGDMTTTTTADDSANTIDFTSDPLVSASLNERNLVRGGGGGDTILLTGSTSNSVLYGEGAGDTITGGNGDDTIYGGSGLADTTDGNDVITVGSGSNIVYANAGDDSISFSAPTTSGETLTVYAGLGNDTINATSAGGTLLYISAAAGSDSITAQSTTCLGIIYGGAGGDTIDIDGATGDHTIYGGTSTADSSDGADSFVLGDGNTVLYANAGADTVSASAATGKTATIYLGRDADVLTSDGSAGTYVIYSGPGSDNIDVSIFTGNSTIYGGSGVSDSSDAADTIIGSTSGNTIIYGNAGNDVITVTPAASKTAIVYAGDGADTITASAGATSATIELYGNGGNNVFNFNFATVAGTINIRDYTLGTNKMNVTLSGGSANDLTVTRTSLATTLTNSGGESIVLHGYSGNFTDSSFVLSGGSILETNFGNNAGTVAGGTGDDQLIAGSNGDTFNPSSGDDLLTGGAGNDTFNFLTADINSSDTIDGGSGTNTIALATPGTSIVDSVFTHVDRVQTLSLATGDYSATGITLGAAASSSGIATLNGSATTKLLVDATSMTRAISITGGSGADTITGSAYIDTISGGAEDDSITGGIRSDSMTGGAGEDIFVYQATTTSSEIGDTITDFDQGTSTAATDIIKVTDDAGNYNLGNNDNIVDGAIISSVIAAGVSGTELIILRSVGIATGSVTTQLNTINANITAGQGVINVFYETTLGYVVAYYDDDGSTAGGQEIMIRFTGLTSLAEMNDFDFTDFTFA